MAGAIDVTVTFKGGLFKKDIPATTRRVLRQEVIDKVHARLMRKGAQGSGGRGKGVLRNTVSDRVGDMEVRVASTLRSPRTRGTKWIGKNIAITKSMAPRVLRRAAERLAAEMGNG